MEPDTWTASVLKMWYEQELMLPEFSSSLRNVKPSAKHASNFDKGNLFCRLFVVEQVTHAFSLSRASTVVN